MKSARAVVVIILCVLMAGCSATRLGYNQLDWLTVWYLNGYFSLDQAQEEQLRDAVRRNLEWHRRNQLPKYAQFCREFDRDIQGELTAELLELRYQRTIQLWDEMIVQMTPDISAFFLALHDEQIDEFIENLEEHNQELWEDYAGETPEERLASRQKGAVKGFKRIVGRLNGEQKELVYSYTASMHDVSEQWMASRRDWQQGFRALIIERPPEPEFSERFFQLMIDPNRSDDADYRQRVDENRKTTINMIIELGALLTNDQRERLSRRLQDLARDFEILAGQHI